VNYFAAISLVLALVFILVAAFAYAYLGACSQGQEDES
jgi:hypothetical protein